MRPLLDASQGRVIRALALYLSQDRKNLMIDGQSSAGLVVEQIQSQPWSSLTFTGTRHTLTVRLPDGATSGTEIDGAAIDITGAIVAVERAEWAGPCLALALIVISTT